MKVFISDFTGLCNRLEALALAYVIRDHFGHRIVLDWPELDSFTVRGAIRGKLRPWHRSASFKVRDCEPTAFESLGRHRNLIVRGLTGAPFKEMAKAALHVAGDLLLAPRLAESIRTLFAPAQIQGRPVIGVHLRRGDFQGAHAPIYDTTQKYAAVPDWWFRHAMARFKAARPDALFYIAGTGDPRALPWLSEFDCLFLHAPSPYSYKGPTHASANDPVAELFALSCCRSILATPASSFSHWAANILGEPSQVFLAPPMTREEAPEIVQLDHRCRVFGEWVDATRKKPLTVPARIEDEAAWARPAQVDWL